MSGILLAVGFGLSNLFGSPVFENCVGIVETNGLMLSDIRPDMHIRIKGCEIDPCAATNFVYRYRAFGFGPDIGGGQLYYSWRGGEDSDRRCWRLPKLVADGNWHSVTVGVDRIVRAKSWFGGGIVDAIRFDPTDSPGGRLEIAWFGFR